MLLNFEYYEIWTIFLLLIQEFKNRPENELREFICNTDTSLGSLRKHTLATYELYKIGGLDWMIKENYRVRNHLEHLLKEATTWLHW
jgi:hypothetical protein